MKIIIYANNQKWSTWKKKIQEIKDWFSPLLKLEIDLVHSNYSNIPFEEYGIHDGFMRHGVAKQWFKDTVRSNQHDITILSVNRKDWRGQPVEGWHWDIGNIALASNEKGSYNFKGVHYSGGKWFNIARHEICHALYAIQGKFDRTHFHWDSGDLSKVLTELQQPQIPEVNIIRNQDDGVQTLGEIYVKGKKFNTLELSLKDNKQNISCIPAGVYDVKYTFSPKFMKYTYEILNVRNRSGIRLHSGNKYTEISGCVLCGNGYRDINGDGRLDIINSTITIKEIEDLLERKPFKLFIK